MQDIFIYVGKEKKWEKMKNEKMRNEKKMGNEGTNCCNCLLKLGGINMRFHQKRL